MAEENSFKYRQAFLGGGKNCISCLGRGQFASKYGGHSLIWMGCSCGGFSMISGKSYRSSPTPYNKWAGSPLWKNKFGGNSELVAPLGARGAKRRTVVAFDAIAGFGCGDRGQFVLSRWRAAWAKNRGRSDESTQRSKNSSDRTRKIKGENWNCFYLVSMAYVVFERIHIWSNVKEEPR